ncbi:valyl-tRNA synthetase [Rubricella aquisinus]|uniref:Valine--tRNA ligase n=1 Tax=Rubricella aquisinus TaxID=2028108 RepID=A0A840X427_9RHOB|nr:valine--tRNA ligase [Rubricella aquisinus]MBB5515417.1 valyl-tRNA synthetase [Rubricella aquisinus]
MTMEKNFDATTSEAAIIAAWEANKAFAAGANAKPGADAFSIVIPPPNVTGSLHMGHAFNNTLQDILVRWHRMRGFDTLWQPGTDHAGIATQMVTERDMAAKGEPTRAEMGREAFLDRVWQQKVASRGTIIGQLKRLGASCDWDREAFTMGGAAGDPDKGSGPNFHDAVIKVFVDLYNKGLIYRGKRLVNWDPHFETAISDLEVENIEVDGHMWHFKYPLAGGATYEYVEKDEDGNVTLRETRDYISIATTRPETMLGDGAVAVHADDERYWPLWKNGTTYCEIPVGPKEHRRLIPIITDEYPDMTFGSGAVKITGAHDFNDYQVAKRGNIPMYSLMDTKGRMRADGRPYAEEAATAQAIANGEEGFDEAKIAAMNLVPEEYRGLDRFEARKKVVADITDEGLAVMHDVTRTDKETGEEITTSEPLVENKKIMQPFGDRSKVVIEPMLTDQWFVDAETLAKPAIEAVESGRTQILPERDAKVYFHWMKNIEPWCISRQLWWGHQVPVWYDAEGNQYCAASEDEAREMAGGAELTRDPDVLDTWFSSGLWPIGTLGWPEQTDELAKYFPTSVLITGFDIIFFWVARMMMMQLETVNDIPFHTVYVHALVRDEKGRKMSKSIGNVIDPLDLIDQYGADAVRFTLTSMAAMGRDLKLSEKRVEGYRNFGTKLWNAARFAEMNGCTGGATEVPQATATVNKWIIGETARLREQVDAALAAYRFNDAASALYAHVWGVFCDWYVEFAKPLLAEGSDAREETQAVMAWALDQCLLMLHPIMPFITEQLWADLGERSKMLVHGDWPDYGAELADAEADAEMAWVIALIEGIRSVRAEMNVNPGAKVPLVMVGADATAQARFARNATLIERLARVVDVTFAEAAPKGAVTLPIEGAEACLPLAGLVDVAAETARLTKALDKVEKEIGGLEKKLANEKFLAKAPEDVVAEQRERLVTAGDEAAKLRLALARVEALK